MRMTWVYQLGRRQALAAMGMIKAAAKYGPLGSRISQHEAALVQSLLQASIGTDAAKQKVQDFQQGLKTEFEHTKDPVVAGKISLDHLKESPRYYTELAKMENKLKTDS